MLSKKSLLKSELRRVSWLVAAALLIGSLGCASKEFSYVTTVSGGEQMKFTFAHGGPVHAKSDGFEVLEASIQPDFAVKKVFYAFRFSDAANGKSLQSVKIEDVSDAAPVLLAEDAQPKLVERVWGTKSRQFSAEDSSLKWVTYVNDSVRIYRFTLTLNDGRTVILHQPTMIPGWIKAGIRGMFGEKY